MRSIVPSLVLLAAGLVVIAGAADVKSTADSAPAFKLPEIGEESPPSRFSEEQVAYMQSWIRQLAPECPIEATAAVAEAFLEELRQRQPEKLDRLFDVNFPSRALTSTLLRHVGAKLAGTAPAPLREKIAERRLTALLAEEAPGTSAAPVDAADLLGRVRDSSAVQHRRLLEGRLEDDDLVLLLKKIRQTGSAPKAAQSAKPKELTASDIVSEFSRRNQAGAALQRLQAYAVEGRLTNGKGEAQDLLMFKLRPDRFRLVVREGGITRYILAADGDRCWQQRPGQRPQLGSARNMGGQRYLGEFIDPLFVGEGYNFERLADGAEGERKYHRIAVRRNDGSKYVACIDAETFRQIARENEDKSIARYSDFREVAGVTIAFREEATGPDGFKAVLVVSRITPNPGLIEEFFRPPALSDPNHFQLEKFWAHATPATGRQN